MTTDYHRLILIFVDGVGLARATADNPFLSEPTPELDNLLGGPMTIEECRQSDDLLLAPIDANLGVEGLPQSSTGQATLFTGLNAAEIMGRHVTGLPGPRVRALVESGNLFSKAVESGYSATFANAYTRTYLDSVATGHRRPSVTTCAVASAGLPFRELAELQQDEAVSWDIVRDRFRAQMGADLPLTTAADAGRHLARIGARNQLTVYETFITDMAGHQRHGFTLRETLARIDGFIGGVAAGLSPRTTLVMTSDHGNIEDQLHRRHTRNPVPLLVIGPLASRFAGIESILEVTPRILDCLGATK